MNRNIRFLFLLGVAMALPLAGADSARAADGVVSGNWRFWNQNGNYCPTGNACVGARYPQSVYNSWQPVSNGTVWILDSGGSLLGAGSTDTAGNYRVAWSRPTFPAQIQVIILPFQKDTRFFFANTAGQWINNTSGNLTTAVSSSTNPQNIGVRSIGTQTAPDWFYNAYWAAERQWRDVMALTGVLTANFTNVEVRGFANTIPGYLTPTGTFPSSAAAGASKRVQLDSQAGLTPQARAMHELGHIATYVTHPWQFGANYTWAPPGQQPGAATWLATSPEFGSAAFEEAFATHYGNIAFWWDNAVTPTTCYSTAHCYNTAGTTPTAGTNIEATSYPSTTNNCNTTATNPESRWPLSAMRFFWDVFDNRNDADGDSYSANNGHFWQHLHNLAWYPNGTSENQHEDPWNPAKDALTEPDGRGSRSYRENYRLNVRDIDILWTDNCSPF